MSSDLPGCHVCGGDPAYQWTRLATEEEAAVQRADIFRLQGRELGDEEIAARYGPLLSAVTGCAEHHLGGGADGGGERRALLHDAGCAGHGDCACAGVAA